jgi:inosine-uridine nucleoside N-ribohydrolase
MNNLNDQRKLIIDTDPGHDDALALLLLIKSNQLAIQAVTTVAGNTTIEKITRNAQAILDVVGSKVPIFSGLPAPLVRPLVTAVVHGTSGLDGFNTTNTQFRLTQDAPQRIVEMVRQNPGEMTILTLGALSNVARAFLLDPQLPSLIKEIVIMGGAINVPGNKNRVAEFNFFVDPEAADMVLRAAVPKVLVPLDACNQVVMQISDFEQMKNSNLRQILLPMMRHFIAGLMDNEGTQGILVYDALAAYYLLNPSAFSLEPMDIVVETKGEFTFGMAVAEKRPYKKMEPNVRVVREVDEAAFRRDFMRIVGE